MAPGNFPRYETNQRVSAALQFGPKATQQRDPARRPAGKASHEPATCASQYGATSDRARYFFDTLDDDGLVPDDVELECSDLEAARAEAVESLADLAREVLPDSAKRKLTIRVRDVDCRTVLVATIVFEVLVVM